MLKKLDDLVDLTHVGFRGMYNVATTHVMHIIQTNENQGTESQGVRQGGLIEYVETLKGV